MQGVSVQKVSIQEVYILGIIVRGIAVWGAGGGLSGTHLSTLFGLQIMTGRNA